MLLSYWGDRYEQLDVFCDRSAPLEASTSILESMVGRASTESLGPFDRKWHTFNLLRLPQYVDSAQTPGVQLADVVAGAAVYGVMHGTSDGKEVVEAILPGVIGGILPDLEYINLTKKGPVLNGFLLTGLATRARNGQDPVELMPEMFAIAEAQYAAGYRPWPIKS